MKLVFLAHLVSTLVMVGVIWTVQVVHYPLFAGVGADGWSAYEAAHQSRITLVVGPLMVAELVTNLDHTLEAALEEVVGP